MFAVEIGFREAGRTHFPRGEPEAFPGQAAFVGRFFPIWATCVLIAGIATVPDAVGEDFGNSGGHVFFWMKAIASRMARGKTTGRRAPVTAAATAAR